MPGVQRPGLPPIGTRNLPAVCAEIVQLGRHAAAGERVAEGFGAHGDERRPAASSSAACRPVCTPPMPTIGTPTRAATSPSCASATARTAGPESPPPPPPSQAAPGRAGSWARARTVLISETASAPWASAAAATSPGAAQLGVSLTISGLAVCGRTASISAAVSPGSAPMIRPVLTFGQETLSSSAATSGRSPKAATSSATSSRRKPMTLTISGTGSSASRGRSWAR